MGGPRTECRRVLGIQPVGVVKDRASQRVGTSRAVEGSLHGGVGVKRHTTQAVIGICDLCSLAGSQREIATVRWVAAV